MPTDHRYTLQELADLADVTPRTIRYYVSQGLLPSPGSVGPGTTYGDGHLSRLRYIRRLIRQHWPLAEIRTRLAGLNDEEVIELAEVTPAEPAPSSAIDYIRGLLRPDDSARSHAEPAPRRFEIEPLPAPPAPGGPGPVAAAPSGPERSQWERLAFTPNVELHVRRPLTRQQNKQVERLISIARSLFEGDSS